MLYLETLDDVLVLTLCIIALPALPGPGSVDAAPGPGGGQTRHPGSVAQDGGLNSRKALSSDITGLGCSLTLTIRLLLLQLIQANISQAVTFSMCLKDISKSCTL